MPDLFFDPNIVRFADRCKAAAEARNKYLAPNSSFMRPLNRGKLAIALARKRQSAEKL